MERRPDDPEPAPNQKPVDMPKVEVMKPSSDPNALRVLPPQRVPPPLPRRTTTLPQYTPNSTTGAVRTPRPQPAAPKTPPVSFNFNRRQSDSAGAGMQGDVAPDVRETDLGRYKAKLYRTVGYRWRLAVAQRESLISISSVRIRFYVRANGVMENVRVVEKSGNATMLELASLEAMMKSMPFEPFSDALRQQLGDGFEDDFTFTIY
ncbi:hypothetical protein DB346_06945 [Verrucomicrobia bacterium LW23]|nr:hypothetical protein DB346_06945 [Verrucomicrobia bacterium LW23]